MRMQLGFLTACLPSWSLTATHIDVKQLTARQAEHVTTIFKDRGLTLSSLAYYDNNLHPDAAERTAVHAHLLACVEAAGRLGCPSETRAGRLEDRPPNAGSADHPLAGPASPTQSIAPGVANNNNQ
jgi:sugar phosphate isomerase/epimerase